MTHAQIDHGMAICFVLMTVGFSCCSVITHVVPNPTVNDWEKPLFQYLCCVLMASFGFMITGIIGVISFGLMIFLEAFSS